MSENANGLVVVRLSSQALDDIPLGVLRVSLDRRVTYLNQAARTLAGPGVTIGTPLDALHFQGESEARLNAALEERRYADRGSSYPITIERPDLGTKVHVIVSGVPEYTPTGEPGGSVGFITDVTMQRANLAVHEAIGIACDWRGLLTALDEQMRAVVAYESIIISLISGDRQALRLFYDGSPERGAPRDPTWRWWPMPAYVKQDLDALLTTRADDVQEMFARPPYSDLARADRATADWLKLGYRHMLRQPVMRNGELTAIVSLFRRQDQPFSATDIERIGQLPIGEAVNMALVLDHQRELSFGLELIGHLGALAGSIADVARVLVEELRKHFDWQHVSLFRVNLDEGTMSVVSQDAQPDARLPDDYAQSIQIGLLGHVARSGQPVRLGNVHDSSVYREGISSTQSEMCLPVPGEPVRWILNVESSALFAFAPEEETTVARLLAVAGLILDRTLALEFNATVLDSVADAVIQTTSRGEIQNVNPACEKLLDRPRDTLIGKHLSALVSAPGSEPDPPGFAARLVAMPRLLPAEIELLPRQGGPIPVLLSGESLPPQIGGKVYVASDLRYRQAVQRMDSLQQVFRQVASESRVPLAIASSYLSELARTPLDTDVADGIDKVLRQLRRADLPLEKVIRLAAVTDGEDLPVQPVSLPVVVDKLVSELPIAHAEMVRVVIGTDLRLARAARPELEFCASSLLAFLLRMKAEDDAVRIQIMREQTRQVLAVELIDPKTLVSSATRLNARSDEEREFALPEPVIRTLMRRMQGSLEVQQGQGLSLRLVLRAWEGE